MGVILRKKSCAGGKKSLYLDIWHNERRVYQFLKLYVIRARTPEQAQKNKETLQLAESIRAKKEIDLQSKGNDFIPAFKRKADFIAYYDKFVTDYKNKDLRLVKCSFTHFKEFIAETELKNGIMFIDIDEDLCKNFKDHLDKKLHGETPHNYFKKFRKVIKQALNDRLLAEDYTINVSNKIGKGLKKDILSIADLQKLYNTECGNDNVKRAFLFCNYTGLRFCDVTNLKWQNIDLVNLKIKITQQKVEKTSDGAILINDLHTSAIELLGKKCEAKNLVFNLPSHTACLKDLKTWVERASIEKHITWHCARHSFAVNQLYYGADVKTVASNLGHADINTVNIYLRAVSELKKKAIDNLPALAKSS